MRLTLILSSLLVFTTTVLETALHAENNILKIITYNIRREGSEKKDEQLWPQRKHRVAQQLMRQQADIICLQEATIAQIKYLKEQLPEYDVVGKGRGASWFGKGTNEYNPIFYDTRRLMLIGFETFSINKTNAMFWNPFTYKTTGLLPRICTTATFKCHETGNIFYVFNTHLDNNYNTARKFGATNIAAYIQEKEPVIITGDFNMEFTTELQTIFSSFHHAKDIATDVSGPKETRTGWNDEELKQIDHILVQKNSIKVLSYGVIQEKKPYASDHRMSYAVITLAH